MAHPHHLIPGLVAVLARRLISHTKYDKQLHILYLANDVLFKALQGRQPPGSAASVDPIASAFLHVLSPMLAATYQRGGRAEEVSLGQSIYLFPLLLGQYRYYNHFLDDYERSAPSCPRY